MANSKHEKKYVEKMKALGLSKICLWAHKSDHHKLKNTARLSRNRIIKAKTGE